MVSVACGKVMVVDRPARSWTRVRERGGTLGYHDGPPALCSRRALEPRAILTTTRPEDDTAGATLLERVAAGEPGAVTQCIDRFGGLVWTLARRMSPTGQDAEDAVQEIFTEVWQSAYRYDRGVASETAFVAMIARRRLIDRYRKLSREPNSVMIDERLDSVSPTGGEGRSDLSEDARKVFDAMRGLSEEQQRVLRLSLLQGLSHDKIARSTGLPLGTVKTHARRGLIKLRGLLTTRSDGAGGGAVDGGRGASQTSGVSS